MIIIIYIKVISFSLRHDPRDDDEDLPTVDDKGVPKLTGSDTLGSHLISDVMETELFRGGLVELSDLTPDSSYTSFVKDLQR